ncbi:MAG: HAMP domain-containing sensor histidine kinase [Desulfofustis sp.]|nr:HAMP domain-containing sensor histidine kinase [Desulfofustis sp.]
MRVIPSLSLRAKLVIILSCYVVGILTMFVVSQRDLGAAKDKLEAIDLAYGLHGIILEVRRYEKNYLLYGTEEALEENKVLLSMALEAIDKMADRVSRLKIHPMLMRLKEVVQAYQRNVGLLSSSYDPYQGTVSSGLVDSLRKEGQEMVELSSELVSFEHRQILSILDELVRQLIVWTVVALAVGVLLPLAVSFKIFKPLRIIKEATEQIATGRFQQIEVLDTQDEMQQVMEALNTMASELQHRQDQLVQSQKLSSIGTLTAGIAHQLNNPLNNIATSCQIAIDEFASGDADLLRRMLKNIDQETLRARDVVQGLLEFSRAREFTVRPESLAAVVNRSVQLVHSQVPATISVTVEVPEDLVVTMDAQRIQEVFINMIFNSVQAIDGSGTIRIAAALDREQVVIEVSDDGSGIPAEIQDRLFDPFYSTKEEGQGTGLGLSIAYGIIQKHGGQISVQSAPGQGATFFIRLPVSATKGVTGDG